MVLPECPSCVRFVDALQKAAVNTPALTSTRTVDARALTPAQRVGIDTVPTLIMDDGRRLGGTAAFEWLDKFRADPGPYSGGNDALGYSGLGGASDGYQVPYSDL